MGISTFIITLLGALSSSITLKGEAKKILSKFSELTPYQKQYIKCYKKSLKKQLDKNKFKKLYRSLRLKLDTAILEEALSAVVNDEIGRTQSLLSKYFQTVDISYHQLQNNINDCLKKKLDAASLPELIIENFAKNHEDNALIKEAVANIGSPDFDMSFQLVIKDFEANVKDGYLTYVLKNIKELLTFDDVKKNEKYFENLILLETKIVLKIEKKDEYDLQLKKLQSLPESFLKHYYIASIYKSKDSNYRFNDYPTSRLDKKIAEDLAKCWSIRENQNPDIPHIIATFETHSLEQQKILLKQLLIHAVNNRIVDEVEEFFKDQIETEDDPEIKFYYLIFQLNIFWSSKQTSEYTLDDKKFLNEKISLVEEYANIFKEYSAPFQESLYYNLTIMKICVDVPVKNLKPDIKFYAGNNELIKNTITKLMSHQRNRDAIKVIDELTEKPDKLTEDRIEVLLRLAEYEEIEQSYKDAEHLSDKARCNVIAAININKANLLKSGFDENELVYGDCEDKAFIKILACELFHKSGKVDIAERYYIQLVKEWNSFSELNKIIMMNLSVLFERIEYVNMIGQNLIEISPVYKFHLAKALYELTDSYSTPSKEVDDLFKSFEKEDDLPGDLFRLKVRYLQIIGETSAALDNLKNLVERYDNINDWFRFIGTLFDYNESPRAKDYISILEQKTEEPAFYLLLGLIYLHTEDTVDNKLNRFYYYFFKAFQDSERKDIKYTESVYFPIWGSLIMKQLFIEYNEEVVNENTYVELKKIDDGTVISICLHTNKELSENAYYLRCHHYKAEDSEAKDLLYKKLNEEINWKGDAYRIVKIDWLKNYPNYYLSDHVFKNAEKYGLEKYKVDPDPIAVMYPQLYENYIAQEDAFNKYSAGKLNLHLLCNFNYENYIAVIQKLLFDKRFIYNAGTSWPIEQDTNIVISYNSLLILEIFGKLSSIPEKNIHIPSSLLRTVERQYNKYKEMQDKEDMSIGLDINKMPIRYVSDSKQKKMDLKTYFEFMERIRRFRTIDVEDENDKYLRFTRFIGEIDVDGIRILNEGNHLLITDDRMTQQLSESSEVSNVVSLYYFLSDDTFDEKIRFLDELSRLNYQNIFYNGLLTNIVQSLIENNYNLFGEGTTPNLVIKLVKRELNKHTRTVHINDFIDSINFLLSKYLVTISEALIMDLLRMLGQKDLNTVVDTCLKINLPHSERMRFLKSTLAKLGVNKYSL